MSFGKSEHVRRRVDPVTYSGGRRGLRGRGKGFFRVISMTHSAFLVSIAARSGILACLPHRLGKEKTSRLHLDGNPTVCFSRHASQCSVCAWSA
jgi:hypothetical protein